MGHLVEDSSGHDNAVTAVSAGDPGRRSLWRSLIERPAVRLKQLDERAARGFSDRAGRSEADEKTR